MKNRVALLALTLALALGLAAPALAAESRFTDAPEESWFAPAVELCAEKGIMVGTSETAFSPEATLTQAECGALALRLHELLHGGDGVLDPAPEDWGKLTVTLSDGTELTGYGRTSVPLPGVEKANFAFSWWTWGMMGLVSADNFQVNLFPEIPFDPEDPDYRAAQEALYDWGKAREGAATVQMGETVITGTVNCWLPVGNWVLAFHPDDDEDGAKREAIRAVWSDNAPESGAWYRDAAYYAAQKELDIPFSTPEEPASRARFATWLALAAGELPQTRQVDMIPGVDEEHLTPDSMENITMLYRAGVLTGKDECGAFDPEGTLTRAEAAAMVARVLDESLRLSDPLASLPAEK